MRKENSFYFYCTIVLAVFFILFAVPAVADETNSSSTENTAVTTDSGTAVDASAEKQATVSDTDDESIKPGELSPVPPARRPKKPNPEKVAAAAARDTDKNTIQKEKDTLAYGIESEISDLIDELTKTEDPRLVDEIYDLFQATKSVAVREKILSYFTMLKDPCLEDYAVTVLNDPYDIKTSTVSLVFRYISAVKCTEAVNAVVNLLESGNEKYFSDALTTLGDIGGEKEAVYLTGYLDKDSLTIPQRQQLMQVLGKLKAVKTWGRLVKIVQNKDENSFVRMYAAEAIGTMQKKESIPVLVKMYEDDDPNFRQYVIKGLSYYPDKEATDVVIQAIRDQYYKVRLEAISAVEKQKLTAAVPFLIYRADNDPENVVKTACYPAIAELNTSEGNTYLVSVLTNKKKNDEIKASVAAALLEYNNAGEKEALELAEECLKDDKRKQLRYALGKLFAKYGRPTYADICKDYILSSDVATAGTGLDIYLKGKYLSCKAVVQALAANDKAGVNQAKAKRILAMQ